MTLGLKDEEVFGVGFHKKYVRVLKLHVLEFLLWCSGLEECCVAAAVAWIQSLARELTYAAGAPIKKKKKKKIACFILQGGSTRLDKNYRASHMEERDLR